MYHWVAAGPNRGRSASVVDDSMLDLCLDDAQAKALVYEPIAAEAVRSSTVARGLARIAVEGEPGRDLPFEALVGRDAPEAAPRADAEAWSVMLYTSGTTARPKG